MRKAVCILLLLCLSCLAITPFLVYAGSEGIAEVVDNPPSFSNLRVNTTEAGATCEFNCTWTDKGGLSGFIFGTDNSGSWINDTWTSLTGTEDVASVVKTLNSVAGTTIYYRFWCNDTSGNLARTGKLPLTLTGEGTESEAGGFYILTIYTTCDGLPCSAQITVENWHSHISDAYGNAYFTLPYGDYKITVTYGNQIQNKTVGLYDHLTVPFDFSIITPDGDGGIPPVAFFLIPILLIFLGWAVFWLKITSKKGR